MKLPKEVDEEMVTDAVNKRAEEIRGFMGNLADRDEAVEAMACIVAAASVLGEACKRHGRPVNAALNLQGAMISLFELALPLAYEGELFKRHEEEVH